MERTIKVKKILALKRLRKVSGWFFGYLWRALKCIGNMASCVNTRVNNEI